MAVVDVIIWRLFTTARRHPVTIEILELSNAEHIATDRFCHKKRSSISYYLALMASQQSGDDIPSSPRVSADDDFDHSAPLLGPPGSVSQRPSQALGMNVILGAAPLAQVGVLGLAFTVWYNVIFRAKWILFTFHPVFSISFQNIVDVM